jgi:acyl-CoA synthetase (AMP-forming)/AMP-acid ligase II
VSDVVTLPASVTERTVPAVLDARALRTPDRTALIACSLVTGDEQARTYAQLRDEADRLAAWLAEAGVHRGDRVGILLDNDGALEAHIAYHAAHRLGAINVPLNTRYVERELRYVLEFIEPSAVVFASRFAELVGRLSGPLGGAALLEAGDPPRLGTSFAEAITAAEPIGARADSGEGEDADWIFTSGTTGHPKAVALTQGGSVACGHQSLRLWGLDQDSVYMSFAPFFTSTGSHTNLLACLVAGCTYVVEPAFDVRGTPERLARHGVTSTFLVSSVLQLMFARLTPEEIAAFELPALRRVVYGAQPASPEFYRRVFEEIGAGWGVELAIVYGLTEGGTSGIMLTPEDHPEALRRIGAYGLSIGRTPFNEWVEHAVLDEHDEQVARGVVGELCLRGPSTMSRYVRDEEATAKALRGGWLHTGDMACVDDAGFVYFVDRSKQLIRRGGLNISSAEVEGVLMEHPGVAEAAVVPLPNPVLGQDVRGVVVAGADPSPTEAELIAFCRERLADYKVPVKIDFVDALPRNAMNRVVKGALTGEAVALRAD